MDAGRSAHLKRTRAVSQRSIDHDKVIKLIDEPTVLHGNVIAGREQNVGVLSMGHSPSHREGQFQFSGGGNEESLLSLIGHVVNSLSEWRAEGDIGEGVEKRYRFGRSLLELTTCSRC